MRTVSLLNTFVVLTVTGFENFTVLFIVFLKCPYPFNSPSR